jgi:hypothetical protein
MAKQRRAVIVEIELPDGLQSEAGFVPTVRKIRLVDRLASCGLPRIEVTAFVLPRWVPQMVVFTAASETLDLDGNVSDGPPPFFRCCPGGEMGKQENLRLACQRINFS